MRMLTHVIFLALTAVCFDLALGPGDAGAAASISGRAVFEGPPPARRQLKMSADPACEKANPEGRLGEALVVAADGGIANVFVYVKEGLGDQTFPRPKQPVEIDQVDCMYTPRVIGAMAGQTIAIRNSDSTLHNVHSLPKNSKQFNNAMPLKGMTIKKRFAASEIMVRMKCDVHPWMGSYVGVVGHPFHAVSSADGSFTISGLPAGTYTMEAWHERLGTKTATVTVADGASANADFSFTPVAK